MKIKIILSIIAIVFSLTLAFTTTSCNKEKSNKDKIDSENPIPDPITWKHFVQEMDRIDSARTSAVETVRKIGE